MEVEITWGVVFGKGNATEPFSDTLELNAEETELYRQAFRDGISPNEVEGLKDALRRAYDKIEKEQIQIGIEEGDEYTLELQRRCPPESPYDNGWTLRVEFEDEFDPDDADE